MTSLIPEDNLDLDPSELMFHTNYGATSMMRNIAAGNQRAKQTSNSIYGLLQQLSQVNSRASSMAAAGPGVRSYTPNRHGSMNGAGRKHRAPNNIKLAALLHAVGQQESGGNYNAVNPIGYKGKYQISPGNIKGKGGWDVEALGHNVSYRKYANSPRIQEKIAEHKMRQYMHQFGLRGAAQAWYGGPGAVGNNNISGGSGYPTTGGYADEIMRMIHHYLRRHRR